MKHDQAGAREQAKKPGGQLLLLNWILCLAFALGSQVLPTRIDAEPLAWTHLVTSAPWNASEGQGYGHQVLSLNGVLYRLPGHDQSTICESSDGITWAPVPHGQLPFDGVVYYGATVFDGLMLVAGGIEQFSDGVGPRVRSGVYVSSDGITWIQRGDIVLPSGGVGGRYGHVLLNEGDSALWVIGGNLYTNDSTTLTNDIIGSSDGGATWQPVQPNNTPPSERVFAAAAVLGGNIYLLGGEDQDSIFDEVWSFDIASATWSEVPTPLPAPSSRHQAISFEEEILILGRGSADFYATQDFLTYTQPYPGQPDWGTTDEFNFAAAHLNDTLFLTGGYYFPSKVWTAPYSGTPTNGGDRSGIRLPNPSELPKAAESSFQLTIKPEAMSLDGMVDISVTLTGASGETTVLEQSVQDEVETNLDVPVNAVLDGIYTVSVRGYNEIAAAYTVAFASGQLHVYNSPIVITSPTHPHSSHWYESPDVTFEWQRPQDCPPEMIHGFHYTLGKNANAIPGTTDAFGTPDTLAASFTLDATDRGLNFFSLRWVDLDGKLSESISRYPFYFVQDHTNAYSDLPWYDNFNAETIDSSIWYQVQDGVAQTGGWIIFNLPGYTQESLWELREGISSVGAFFDHLPPRDFPHQLDFHARLTKTGPVYAINYLVIGLRSDRQFRHPSPEPYNWNDYLELRNAIEVRVSNSGGYVYQRTTTASGAVNDALLASPVNLGDVEAGVDLTLVDTGKQIMIYKFGDPKPLLVAYNDRVIDGGFIFSGVGFADNPADQTSRSIYPQTEVSMDWLKVSIPTKPTLQNVRVLQSRGLSHVTSTTPIFAWDFVDNDDRQYRYQLQVQHLNASWQDPLIWDTGEVVSRSVQITYGDGGAPENQIALQEGQRYKFRLRVQDRTLWSHTWIGGDYQEFEFGINTLPVITNVAIVPDSPTTYDTLLAQLTVSDPLDESVTVAYRWTRDGLLQPDLTGDMVPAERTTVGEAWQVQVTASDAVGEGESRYAQVVIVGTAGASIPTAVDLRLDGMAYDNPTDIERLQRMTTTSPQLSWDFDDPMGEGQQAWQAQVLSGVGAAQSILWDSGVVGTAAASVSIGGSLAQSGAYRARVRVRNSQHWSEWSEIPFRINTPPVITVVKVEPGLEVGPGDQIRAVAYAVDAENDPLNVSYRWDRNGSSVLGVDQLVSQGMTIPGEEWRAVATVADPVSGDSPAQSDAISIVDSFAFTPSIEYDAVGNMVRTGERIHEFDQDNRKMATRIAGRPISSSLYGASEARAVSSGADDSVFHFSSLAKRENVGEGLVDFKLVELTKTVIAEVRSPLNVSWYSENHYGSVNVTSDLTGNPVSMREYFPYGTLRSASGVGESFLQYSGKETDASGHVYFGARFFDPVVMCFISADSVVPNYANPQSLNRYSFNLSNPVNIEDPDGHAGSLVGAGAGALVGAGSYLIFDVMIAGESPTWAAASGYIVGGAVTGAVVGGLVTGETYLAGAGAVLVGGAASVVGLAANQVTQMTVSNFVTDEEVQEFTVQDYIGAFVGGGLPGGLGDHAGREAVTLGREALGAVLAEVSGRTVGGLAKNAADKGDFDASSNRGSQSRRGASSSRSMGTMNLLSKKVQDAAKSGRYKTAGDLFRAFGSQSSDTGSSSKSKVGSTNGSGSDSGSTEAGGGN